MDLGFYFKIFLRRLPYFLVLVALGAAVGITLAVMLPPVYRAEAKLLVESEQIPSNLAASTVRTGSVEQLQIIRQRILSREVLLEMANRLGIYDSEYARMPADAKVADLRNRIGFNVTGGAKRRGPTQAMIITVSFQAPKAQLASDVTNELVTMILQENVNIRTAVAGQTLDFFNREVDRLDRELTQINSRILQFKKDNINALPDSLDYRRSRQTSLQERLTQLQRGETVLQDRRDRLVKMFEALGPEALAAADDKNATPEARRLKALRQEYESQTLVLSPTNPKVQMLKTQIDALEKVVAGQQALNSGPADGEAPPSQLDIQLADIDAQVDYIAQQRTQIQAELDEVNKSIGQTPDNAVTLTTMDRELQSVQAQYDNAVRSRSRAETGDIIESLSKGERITVLEQATTPREPNSPNRPMVAAAGLGAGLAAGLALVLLLELLNNAIRRPVELTNKLGITPFGTVPYIWTQQQLWRRRAIIMGSIATVLVAVPVGLWFVDSQVTPIQPLINRLLDRFNFSLAGDVSILTRLL